MRHTTRLALLSAAITCMLAVLPALTSACGGFFCTNTPIDQGAERIIFAVNQAEGTITAVVGINYVGAAADFSWVVPVPSPPTLDVAETASLDTLELATAVQVNNPPSPCAYLFQYDMGLGGGGDDYYLEQGNVGPYDYAIIGSDDPDEMIAWLRDNGYQITREMEPLVRVYVEEEMYFLAMKLSQDAQVGDIQPIVMTYESDQPMIPIRLTAVAAIEDMPIITWIFADQQYMPENYAHPSVDFSAFVGPSQVATVGDLYSFSFFYNGSQAYAAARNQIQAEHNGLAFITEYAQPSSALADFIQGDPLLKRLIDQHPYVTRLRAQMSPEQMTLDPEFVPAPYEPDVSNVVDLADWVDPLRFWGCSSRTALREPALSNLPDAHTRIDELQFDVAHPDGWVLSEFTAFDGTPVWALASKPVDRSAVEAFFDGVQTTPMFVFWEFEGHTWDITSDNLLLWLGEEQADIALPGVDAHMPARVRYWPFQLDYSDGLPRGIAFALLTSEPDWEANGALYDAMLAYADSFQYYRDPTLRNTLFLTNEQFSSYPTGEEVAYPDGWVERTTDDGDIVIAPEDAADETSAPLMRLTPISNFSDLDLAAEWMVEHYGLSVEPDARTLRGERTPCSTTAMVWPFERDGRRGLVMFSERYIVEASAPASDYAGLEETLDTMMDAYHLEMQCG